MVPSENASCILLVLVQPHSFCSFALLCHSCSLFRLPSVTLGQPEINRVQRLSQTINHWHKRVGACIHTSKSTHLTVIYNCTHRAIVVVTVVTRAPPWTNFSRYNFIGHVSLTSTTCTAVHSMKYPQKYRPFRIYYHVVECTYVSVYYKLAQVNTRYGYGRLRYKYIVTRSPSHHCETEQQVLL